MDSQSLIFLFTKISSIFNLLLMVSSSLLNPLVFLICVKSKRLRSTSTFKLLAVSSINDFFCNLPWNQEAFTNSFFDFQSPFRSLFYCRWISVFLQFSSFEFTSWLLVSVSVDRLLSMTIKPWSKTMFNGSKPVIYAIVLAFIILAINFHEVFTAGYSFVVNGTEIVVCYSNPPGEYPWYVTMSQVLLYFGYIGPFCLLFIVNSIIILKATKFNRSHKVGTAPTAATRNNQKKAQMTRTVYSITFFYLITTLPSSVIGGYYYGYMLTLPTGQLIVNIINAAQSVYQAFNFVVLYISNKLFAAEVKSIFSSVNERWVSFSNKSNIGRTNANTNTNSNSKSKSNNLNQSKEASQNPPLDFPI